MKGLSTAMRNAVTGTPFCVYESRGSAVRRPISTTRFNTFATSFLHNLRPHGHTQTAQCAAKRSEQRPLPILRLLRQYQPHQRPAHGLRRRTLVTLERQLIPLVLLPRPGLTSDGRRVLAGPHNRVPLRPSRKRIG